MLSREQLEDAINCENLICRRCSIDGKRSCIPVVAQTALELMDKLEKAIQLLRDEDCCKFCVSFSKAIKSDPCKKCCASSERIPFWVFNEKLLEG